MPNDAMNPSVTETLRAEAPSLPPASPKSFINLPDQPVVVIKPSGPWSAVNLRDLWQYRELLYFLSWRDVKVRYKQTLFGIAWVVMQPVLSTIIFTIFLGKLARVPSDGFPYPVFVYAALLPWNFFSLAVISSGNSLVGSAHLITKVYFPRIIVPAAAVTARLLDFAIGFLILIGLMFYYGVHLTPNLLLLPFVILLLPLLAFSIGIWLSAINVKYRDIGVALPVLMQLWMFVSPVVYPSSIVYAQTGKSFWELLYSLNPLVGIIDNFRAALYGLPFNWFALAASVVITIAVFVFGIYNFKRMEKSFADII